MKVVVEFDIELIRGTDYQLFQDLFDGFNKLDWYVRDQYGELSRQYTINIETVMGKTCALTRIFEGQI